MLLLETPTLGRPVTPATSEERLDLAATDGESRERTRADVTAAELGGNAVPVEIAGHYPRCSRA